MTADTRQRAALQLCRFCLVLGRATNGWTHSSRRPHRNPGGRLTEFTHREHRTIIHARGVMSGQEDFRDLRKPE